MSDKLPCEYKIEKDGLKFFLAEPWNEAALQQAVEVIRNPEAKHFSRNLADALSGRGMIKFTDLPGVGSVAIKQYRRGGLLRFLIKERYLKSNPPRPAVEWEVLRQAQELGINVPTPLGYALEGSLFYKAWLFTREIPKHKSLSEIAQVDLSRLTPLVEKLVAQVTTLISSGIRHIDLHPGNVVVSDNDQVYLLDFDKSEKTELDRKDLRDQYVWRWRRAVIKHKLPEQLSELFCLGLRRSAILD